MHQASNTIHNAKWFFYGVHFILRIITLKTLLEIFTQKKNYYQIVVTYKENLRMPLQTFLYLSTSSLMEEIKLRNKIF